MNIRNYLVIVLMYVSLCFGGCKDDEPLRELNVIEKEIVESSNAFGLKLFNEVIAQSEGDNVFISPLSVSMALGMTYNGANGTTEEGMRETLEFGDLTNEEINQGYKTLIDLLTSMDPKVTMEIANSIWYREGWGVHEEFIDLSETYFDAVVQDLDFGDPSAVDTMNDWVDEATNGTIPEIIEGPIDISTVIFLINAIYFKGDWQYMFVEDGTEDAPFTTPDGEKTVKMMHQSADLPYLSTSEFTAVSLPYGDGLFHMTLILPAWDKDLDELAVEMAATGLDDWMDGTEVAGVYVELPRFELEYDSELKEVLSALGMEDAFEYPPADFTEMCVIDGCFVDKVIHKTFVKIDELGTEAGAATVVEVQWESAAPGAIPVIFNRPFLFLIHDIHSESLMFIGKIVDPPSA